MIAPNSIAFRLEKCRRRSPEAPGCRLRAVLVKQVEHLGAMGSFALVDEIRRDTRRPWTQAHRAEPVVCDVRELLPLSYLENLSAVRAS